jgi:hypothetical protein
MLLCALHPAAQVAAQDAHAVTDPPSRGKRHLFFWRPAHDGSTVVVLNPFPPGSAKKFCQRLLWAMCWGIWAGFMGFLVAMPLSEAGTAHFVDALQRQQSTRSSRYRFAVFVSRFWLLPPIVHIFLVWGAAVLSQRTGYVANGWQSFAALLRACYGNSRQQQQQKAVGAHAGCSSDPAIDQLFFPAANLRTDRERAWVNTAMWVVVFSIKVAFELPLVIYPLVRLMQTVSKWL